VGSAIAAGPNSINWQNWDKSNPNRYRTDITYCSPAQINGQVSGALYTTDQDALRNAKQGNAGGPLVNANIYDDANQVYLNGGPDKCDGSNQKTMQLPEGYYFFMITDPPGKVRLSLDVVEKRIVYVDANGYFTPTRSGPTPNKAHTGPQVDSWDTEVAAGYNDYEQTGALSLNGFLPTPENHFFYFGASGTGTQGCTNKITVQMMPFAPTPNPGGEYKAWLTPTCWFYPGWRDLPPMSPLDRMTSTPHMGSFINTPRPTTSK